MTKGLHRYQQAGNLHFITFSCYHRLPYLGGPTSRALFESSLERIRTSRTSAALTEAKEIVTTLIRSFQERQVEEALFARQG